MLLCGLTCVEDWCSRRPSSPCSEWAVGKEPFGEKRFLCALQSRCVAHRAFQFVCGVGLASGWNRGRWYGTAMCMVVAALAMHWRVAAVEFRLRCPSCCLLCCAGCREAYRFGMRGTCQARSWRRLVSRWPVRSLVRRVARLACCRRSRTVACVCVCVAALCARPY